MVFLVTRKKGKGNIFIRKGLENLRSAVKNIFLGGCLLLAVFLGSAIAQDASITLRKSIYAPGEEIYVSFTALPDFAENAWIGIIPSNVPHGKESVNDQYDISYQYLEKNTSGVLTFIAPLQEGNYDFRMHNTDSSDGVEVASVSFTVQGSLLPQEASITLQKNVFAPGEEILVSFAAPPGFADNAWIGIIPSDVPHGRESVNDQHDISYLYLHKKTLGELKFTAPSQEGSYDFRMHNTDSSDGVEVASVSFTVSK